MGVSTEVNFVHISRVATVASVLLLGTLTWIADKTYRQVDKAIEEIQTVNRIVAVQQATLLYHDQRIRRLEGSEGR